MTHSGKSMMMGLITEYFMQDIYSYLQSYFINCPSYECGDYGGLGDVRLCGVEPIKIHHASMDENILSFSLDMKCEIENDSNYYEGYTGMRPKDLWRTMRGKVTLDEKPHSFSILEISPYSRRDATNNEVTYSFVPIIAKNQFEQEARLFLEKYFPPGLQSPTSIPIKEIAETGLNLTIMNHHITEDFTAFGAMCFSSALIQLFDPEEYYVDVKVKPGTMIIDPDTFFKRNLGCLNNTIAHECVHWYRHRHYHFMQNFVEGKQSLVCRCPVDGPEEETEQKTSWDDIDWMEWHANSIAPRILLPENTFREKALTLIQGNKNQKNSYQLLISQLATFFRVSKQSVEIRMKELGIGS